MVDYVRDPTLHDNFDGGSATWVVWAHTWLVTSLSFFFSFFFFFLLSSSRSQVAFLDRSGRSIRQNACFGQGCGFWGLDNIWLQSKLRGMITTRRYTNPRLPLPLLNCSSLTITVKLSSRTFFTFFTQWIYIECYAAIIFTSLTSPALSLTNVNSKTKIVKYGLLNSALSEY